MGYELIKNPTVDINELVESFVPKLQNLNYYQLQSNWLLKQDLVMWKEYDKLRN